MPAPHAAAWDGAEFPHILYEWVTHTTYMQLSEGKTCT